MLVLKRKPIPGENKVYMGKDITISILGVVEDGSVRVGFDAPRDVEIEREEVRVRRKSSTQKD